MKIAICGSLTFAKEMGELKIELQKLGHRVAVPFSAEKILAGEYSGAEIEKAKNKNTFYKLVIKNDAIRKWHEIIKRNDAILVANFEKKGIKNYIGGNVFLEMGFAHILRKKIFLLNPIPDVSYKDEILAMSPIVIKKDIRLIR